MKYLLVFSFILFSMSSWASYFSNAQYSKVDTNGLPISSKKAIRLAFERADYWDHDQFEKKRYLWVIDFSLHSSIKRGLLIDLKKGKIERYLVSHGVNSGDKRGNATKFSNVVNSLQTSLGLYQTAEVYRGKHGKSIRLQGLESTNDRAYERAIVIHSADYVSEALVESTGKIGNSEGCPAVEKKYIRRIIRRLKKGAFVYMFHEKFSNQN